MKTLLPRVLFLVFPVWLQAQTSDATLDSLWREYIQKYKDIAMDEMERSGIPASIKLAQGILESRAGTSELALNANNHFGIKCGKGWKGKTYSKNDDERNRKGERVNSCFRRYDSVVECFADHSEFIQNPEKRHRYGFLFELDPLDYKAWSQGLQDAGYSSVDYYAEKLIFFIERYRLHEYDALAVNGRVALKRLAQINDVKMVQARPGETLEEVADLYNLPVEFLMQYNDYGYQPDQPLSIGAWVFVQSKRANWGGPALFHTVEENQSLFQIAQMYGVQLEALRQRNGLKPGEEPKAGDRIRLKGTGSTVAGVQSRRSEPLDSAPVVQTGLPAGAAVASSRFNIEMLPEEQLLEPVPVYVPAQGDSLRTNLPGASILLLDHEDPEPALTIDLSSGGTGIYHTVSRGETLYSIARKYQVSTAQLRKLNRLKDNILSIGQSLRVN